jgi:hypothetical protein
MTSIQAQVVWGALKGPHSLYCVDDHNRYATAIETGQASFNTTNTSTAATNSSSIDSVADAKHFGTTSDADIEFKQLIWSLLSDLATHNEECHGERTNSNLVCPTIKLTSCVRVYDSAIADSHTYHAYV